MLEAKHMRKKIFWDGIEMVTGSGIKGKLLNLIFKDEEGKSYRWTPRWENVLELFKNSCEVEIDNFLTSEYIPRFVEVAREVFEKCSTVTEAIVIYGTINRVLEGRRLEIEKYEPYVLNEGDEPAKSLKWHKSIICLPAVFPITHGFLRKWAAKDWTEILIINGEVCALRKCRSEKWEHP